MRSPDVLFRVELKSIESLYSESGRGFYIPPYQRSYTWGNEQVDRLAEDLSSGLRSWIESEDTVTFLGSIILLKDDLFDQVQPAIKEHLPSEVMVVIDGQQRLSTLALLGTLLHEELARRGDLVMRESFLGSQWLENKYKQMEFRLRPLFELNVGIGTFPYYPKLIRAYDDQWSHDLTLARYASPIGQYLNQYIAAFHDDSNSESYKTDSGGTGGKIILAVQRRFRRHLKSMVEGIGPDGEPIFGLDQHFPLQTQRQIFRDEIPRDLYSFVVTPEGTAARELLNLVALSHYFMTRCSVTLTVPMEDRFAFELFERLNTTGQQLTAYETFKPLVVKAEGLSEYRESESHAWISEVDRFVPENLAYEKRARATHDLLLPFAMAEKGDRLAKKLGQQRNWLRTTYESLQGLSEKRRFVLELRNLVSFLGDCYRYGKGELTSATSFQSVELSDASLALLCLDYLKQAKNEICIGPLSRFYSEYALNPTPDRAIDLENAIRASASFFTLYRWAFGTSGLPDAYRRLMHIGDSEHGINPMGMLVGDAQLPTGIEFGAFLGRCLQVKLRGGKEAWIKRVKTRPIYSNAALTKFALSAAFHHTVPDSTAAELALPCEDATESLDMMSLRQWCANPQIEHIAPRVRTSGWADNLYEGETIDLIGNLLLAPKLLACGLSNSTWERKRLYYRVLASPLDVVRYLDSDAVDLSALTPASLQVVKESNYDALVGPIAAISGEWTADVVHARSERLASLVWNRLGKWIGLESE